MSCGLNSSALQKSVAATSLFSSHKVANSKMFPVYLNFLQVKNNINIAAFFYFLLVQFYISRSMIYSGMLLYLQVYSFPYKTKKPCFLHIFFKAWLYSGTSSDVQHILESENL